MILNDLIYFFSIIFFIFIFNKIFFYKKKSLIFSNYFKKFLIFSFITISGSFLILSNYNLDIIQNFSNKIFVWLIIYVLIFLSFFLTISVRFFDSPTKIIYDKIFLNNKISYNRLYSEIQKEKIIEKRIIDLKNQKLISLKNNYIYLTTFGYSFARVFSFLKNLFKIKNEG